MKRQLIAAGAALALAAASGAGLASPARLDAGLYTPRDGAVRVSEAAYRRHTCIARSRTAVGYWTSTSLATAKRQALIQCALRTPRGYVCYTTSCK